MRKKKKHGKLERGTLTVRTGTMFSGKTEWSIHAVTQLIEHSGKVVLVFKPSIDRRSSAGFIESYSGRKLPAIEINPKHPEQILRNVIAHSKLTRVDAVLVSEGQFFPPRLPPQIGLVMVVDQLLDLGIDVLIEGLDLDFTGRPFGSMPHLMAMVDSSSGIIKMHSYCTKCGRPARLPQRLIKGRPANFNSKLIVVGGREKYEPRCYRCHQVPGKPKISV